MDRDEIHHKMSKKVMTPDYSHWNGEKFKDRLGIKWDIKKHIKHDLILDWGGEQSPVDSWLMVICVCVFTWSTIHRPERTEPLRGACQVAQLTKVIFHLNTRNDEAGSKLPFQGWCSALE